MRDPRGFAVKLYTEDGNWDLVGNNTPIFFIRDPILVRGPFFPHDYRGSLWGKGVLTPFGSFNSTMKGAAQMVRLIFSLFFSFPASSTLRRETLKPT